MLSLVIPCLIDSMSHALWDEGKAYCVPNLYRTCHTSWIIMKSWDCFLSGRGGSEFKDSLSCYGSLNSKILTVSFKVTSQQYRPTPLYTYTHARRHTHTLHSRYTVAISLVPCSFYAREPDGRPGSCMIRKLAMGGRMETKLNLICYSALSPLVLLL